MTQLIKCYEFVSRYQTHLTRYVNQFVTIKNKRWEAFKQNHPDQIDPKAFYEALFKHQLIWSSSTSFRKSQGVDKVRNDQALKNLLRWFGDTSFLLYHPVFKLDDLEVEMDLILITPSAIWVMVYLISEKGSVFQGRSRRQWTEVRSEDEKHLVNPLLSLGRSTEIVRRCLEEEKGRLPIKSVLIAPESFIEFADPGRGVQIVDQSQFPSWLKDMEAYRAPVKRQQLQMAELLLKHSSTKADIR